MSKIVCGNCGGKVPLPAGFSKAKIRCGMCGYYASVPPEMRSAASDEDEAAPPPKKGKAKASARPAPKPPVTTSDDTPLEPPDPPPPPKRGTAPPPPPKRSVVAPIDDTDEDEAAPPPPRRAEADEPDRPKPVRARPKANPRDKRPDFAPKEGQGKPFLEGNQDEDDASPYGVEGDGLMRCPECQGELPHDATFCVHCGTHLTEEGEAVRQRPRKKRTYTPIDQQFGEGFPLTTRIAVMGGVLVLNVLLTIAGVIAAEEGKPDRVGLITGGLVFFVNSGLQAFILGSYDTLRVQRNEKGKGTLTRTRRVAFIPLAAEVIEWKHLTGVGRIATHAGSIIDWVTCVYLLTAAGCLPGILFWWFVLKPERYHTVLCNLYGGVEETLFRGKDQKQAEEIADLVGEATGLEVRGIL